MELVSSRSPVGVSSFTDRGGSLVVTSGKILYGGAVSPTVSLDAVPCAEYRCVPGPPLYRQGESRPPNARCNNDQISGQLKGQAKAVTLHDEKVEQYVEKLCWVALITMLSVLMWVYRCVLMCTARLEIRVPPLEASQSGCP